MALNVNESASCEAEIFGTNVKLLHSMCDALKRHIRLRRAEVDAALLNFAERVLDSDQELKRFRSYVEEIFWRLDSSDFNASRQFELGELTSSLLLLLSFRVGLEGRTDLTAAALIDFHVIEPEIEMAGV